MRTRMPRGRSGQAPPWAECWRAGKSGPAVGGRDGPLGPAGPDRHWAGLGPVVAVLTAGRAAGYLCWAASGTLGLLLTPDKGIAALYLAFFGLYPVVKARLESMDRPVGGVGPEADLFQRGAYGFRGAVPTADLPRPAQLDDRPARAVRAGKSGLRFI